MSKCTRDRWGKGCTSDRPQTTEQTKEIEANFKKMLADRGGQDRTFYGGNLSPTVVKDSLEQSVNTKSSKNK